MISNGIDLVKIDRFEDLKNNCTFMNNTFSDNELEYISFRNKDTSTIAGLYAAKEACLKALKKGLNYCPLKDIEISHENNAPFIIFHNSFADTNDNISLSISHDGDYAIAVVSIII